MVRFGAVIVDVTPPGDEGVGGFVVGEATAVTEEIARAAEVLLPQLTNAPREERPSLADVLGHPATRVLLARDAKGTIVGMTTLVLYPIPTGVRGWIEDVVVDEPSRGQGVASALVGAALEIAARSGARSVDLTSRPSREAANRLYERLGFVRRETNVYRYVVEN